VCVIIYAGALGYKGNIVKKYMVTAGLMAIVIAISYAAINLGSNNLSPQSEEADISQFREAITCEMHYVDAGGDARLGVCLSGAHTRESFGAVPGDFLVIVGDITIDELLWSEPHLNKFLADEEVVAAYIDSQNNNIDELISSRSSSSSLREFVATLDNGHITNADELLAALRILRIPPAGVDLYLSELQEHFNVVIIP